MNKNNHIYVKGCKNQNGSVTQVKGMGIWKFKSCIPGVIVAHLIATLYLKYESDCSLVKTKERNGIEKKVPRHT